MPGRFLTRNEVAAELGVSAWTVYRLIRLGRLRAVRVGRMWRVGVEDLASYRERRR